MQRNKISIINWNFPRRYQGHRKHNQKKGTLVVDFHRVDENPSLQSVYQIRAETSQQFEQKPSVI